LGIRAYFVIRAYSFVLFTRLRFGELAVEGVEVFGDGVLAGGELFLDGLGQAEVILKGTGHGGGHNDPEILNSFLIVSGPAAQSGQLDETVYLVDAAATVLAHLGVKVKEEWKLDGKPVGLTSP